MKTLTVKTKISCQYCSLPELFIVEFETIFGTMAFKVKEMEIKNSDKLLAEELEEKAIAIAIKMLKAHQKEYFGA